MKKLFIPVLLLILASCSYDDMLLTDAVELGAVPEVVLAQKAGGEVEIPYYANLSGTVSLLDQAPWAHLQEDAFSSDGTLKITVEGNTGIRRYARVVFSANRKASLTLCPWAFPAWWYTTGWETRKYRLPSPCRHHR